MTNYNPNYNPKIDGIPLDKMDVFSEEFNYLMYSVLEKFKNENDDMMVMSIHMKVRELMDEIDLY